MHIKTKQKMEQAIISFNIIESRANEIRDSISDIGDDELMTEETRTFYNHLKTMSGSLVQFIDRFKKKSDFNDAEDAILCGDLSQMDNLITAIQTSTDQITALSKG